MNTPDEQAPEKRSPEENDTEQAMMTAIDKLMQSGGCLFLGSDRKLQEWMRKSTSKLDDLIPKGQSVLFLSGDSTITTFTNMFNSLEKNDPRREKYEQMHMIWHHGSEKVEEILVKLRGDKKTNGGTDSESPASLISSQEKGIEPWRNIFLGEDRALPLLSTRIMLKLTQWFPAATASTPSDTANSGWVVTAA